MAETTNYKTKAERMTKKFLKSARAFLAVKLTGDPDGKIPEEFELNIILLESYYKTFTMLDLQINDMETLTVDSRYGPQPSPLLAIRDKACVRLESLMKSLGMTLKSGKVLGTTEVKQKETPLEKFLKKQNKE